MKSRMYYHSFVSTPPFQHLLDDSTHVTASTPPICHTQLATSYARASHIQLLLLSTLPASSYLNCVYHPWLQCACYLTNVWGYRGECSKGTWEANFASSRPQIPTLLTRIQSQSACGILFCCRPNGDRSWRSTSNSWRLRIKAGNEASRWCVREDAWFGFLFT